MLSEPDTIDVATPIGTDALMLAIMDMQPWSQPNSEERFAQFRRKLDAVVVTFWRAPHSYTGEETVEISCHGHPHIVENIVEA